MLKAQRLHRQRQIRHGPDRLCESRVVGAAAYRQAAAQAGFRDQRAVGLARAAPGGAGGWLYNRHQQQYGY